VIQDPTERDLKRAEYLEVMEQALKEECIPQVRDTITFPPELRILAEHIGGLSGPGLHHFQERYPAPFWTGYGGGGGDAESYRKEVLSVGELASWAFTEDDPEWEAAGGWLSGAGYDSMCCVVYCRRRGEDFWSWRYTNSGQYGWYVFDTIPDMLEWYATWRVQKLEDLPEFCEDEVFQDGF
jgi:hypothetical protein